MRRVVAAVLAAVVVGAGVTACRDDGTDYYDDPVIIVDHGHTTTSTRTVTKTPRTTKATPRATRSRRR